MTPKEIVMGRSDPTVTIFVPWDCGNNCSFCSTKVEYRDKYVDVPIDVLMDRVEKSINVVAESQHVQNVVFTGGEPLADLDMLSRLVQAVPHGKNLYINTSLHVTNTEDVIRKLKSRLWDGIDGISLSCHICKDGFFDIGILETARILSEMRDVRINSLVNGDEDSSTICSFCDTVLSGGGFSYLNFRADYRHVSQSELGSADDQFFKTLMSIPDWEYLGSSGCLVCRTDAFQTPYGIVDYHRGVESTALWFGEKLVINDFVIKQDGEIRYDWGENATLTEVMSAALGMKID